MPFYIGTGPHDLYQLKGGKNTKYRAVYIGTEHIWPEYILGSVDGSLWHEGYDNALKNYGDIIRDGGGQVNRGSGAIDEELQPEFDPAGGTFSLLMNCRESSSWHFMPFQICVPEEVDLIDVREDGQPDQFSGMVISAPTPVTYTGYAGEPYDAKIYTVQLDPYNEQINEVTVLDKPIKLTFTLGPNYNPELRVRDIILYNWQNEWDEWQLDNSNRITLTIYRQQPNFLYETQGSWILDGNLHKPTPGNPLNGANGSARVTVDWETTSKEVYIAISFGISQDGRKTWTYGPPNDHRNTQDKLNINEGNIIEDIHNYLKVYSDNEYLTATVGSPMAAYGYYVIPVTISSTVNNELNNPSKTIYYQWASGTNNTNFASPAGGAPATNPVADVSRTIQYIERCTAADDRETNLTAEFCWEKHHFALGMPDPYAGN